MSSKQKKKTSSSNKKKTSSSSSSKSKTPKPKPQAQPETSKRMVYPSWDLRLGDSDLEGLGVFAARNFKKGEVVEICPYLQIFKGHLDD